MRRKPGQGLDVGGHWIVPVRETVSRTELSYIIEVPESTVVDLLDEEPGDGLVAIDVRVAHQLLTELALCGYTDWRDASLFGELIAGRRHIDAQGWVWPAVDCRAFGRPFEVRTTHPADAVELDLAEWRRRRARHRASGRG